MSELRESACLSSTYLKCHNCESKYDLDQNGRCLKCGGILHVNYNYNELEYKEVMKSFTNGSDGIWKYSMLLPPINDENIISLGEGNTSLIKSTNIQKDLGIHSLFFKNETTNPTGSFKDRASSVSISLAKEFSHNAIVISSSGNAAASAAAYAARGNIKCNVFIPESTPKSKIKQSRIYGANILKIKGNFSDSFKEAIVQSNEIKCPNLTSTFLNPFAIEGYKTIAFEIWQQLIDCPDWILVPTGAGPLLYGIYKGFVEINKLGFIDKIPRFVAIQSEGCMPIVRGFESKSKVKMWDNPHTIASAISDTLNGYEDEGDLVLDIVYKTNGYAVSVSDDEIIESSMELGSKEGIYVEYAAASSIAGFKKMVGNKMFKSNDVIICILTGSGLKEDDNNIQ